MATGRRALTFAALGLFALLSSSALTPHVRGQAHALEDFAGRYAWAGGQRERDRQHAAIDSVADRLNIFIREIARGEIRRNLEPERRLSIAVPSESRIRLVIDDWNPPPVPLDWTSRRVTGPDDSATQLRARFRRGRLETHQRNGQGSRENWMSLSSDARFLYMQVRVAADQLPAAIRYTLTFRRR